MSQNDTTSDSTESETAVATVSGNNNSDTGHVHVPAEVQRELGICIDTTVSVTIHDIEHKYVDSASFENKQRCGDYVAVPAEFMREFDIEPSTEFEMTFSLVEDEDDGLADDKGAVESEDTQEEADEEEKGLGELFG